MNAELLLEHFHRLGDAPDAVPRLRRFILDLAVRGRLVLQNAADQPASELLEEIKADILARSQSRRIKDWDDLGDVGADEISFECPESWCWTRLAFVSMCLDHMREPVNSTEREKRIEGKDEAQLYPYYGATQQQGLINDFLFDEELVLLGEDGVPFFDDLRPKAYLIRGKSWVNNHAHVFRVVRASSTFVLYWLNTFNYVGRVAGATRGKLNKSKALDIPLALPPLPEQHRIVAKVEELMALCDQLEAAQQQREQERTRLTAAAWQGVVAEPAAAPARFALEQLPALTTRPEQVKALRQTILDLAVRGRLVEQDERDEPAGVLLEKIRKEKERLVREGVIPKEKFLKREADGGSLPRNWKAVQLGELMNQVTSGSRGWAEYYADEGPKFIRAQNIRFGTLRLDELACVNPPQRTEGVRTQVTKGDLLMVITGAGVTNPAMLEDDLGEAYVSQHVGLMKPTSTEVSKWVLLCLMAPAGGRAELIERAYGAGKPGLNLDNIRSLHIPLAPLAEQRRIVAKVEELMALCDGLEAALREGEELKAKALEGVLASGLRPKEYEEPKGELRMAAEP